MYRQNASRLPFSLEAVAFLTILIVGIGRSNDHTVSVSTSLNQEAGLQTLSPGDSFTVYFFESGVRECNTFSSYERSQQDELRVHVEDSANQIRSILIDGNSGVLFFKGCRKN